MLQYAVSHRCIFIYTYLTVYKYLYKTLPNKHFFSVTATKTSVGQLFSWDQDKLLCKAYATIITSDLIGRLSLSIINQTIKYSLDLHWRPDSDFVQITYGEAQIYTEFCTYHTQINK